MMIKKVTWGALLLVFCCFSDLKADGDLVFADDFNRADSNIVGNGWVEVTDTALGIENQQLKPDNSYFHVALGHDLDLNLFEADHARVSCKVTIGPIDSDSPGYFYLMFTDDHTWTFNGTDVCCILYVSDFSTSVCMLYDNPDYNWQWENCVSFPTLQAGDEVHVELQSQPGHRYEGRVWKVGAPRPEKPTTYVEMKGNANPLTGVYLFFENLEWTGHSAPKGPFHSVDDVVVENHCDPFAWVVKEQGLTRITVGDAADGLSNLDTASMNVKVGGREVTQQLLELLFTPYGHLLINDPVADMFFLLDLEDQAIEVSLCDKDGHCVGFEK